ncbi:MAG: glycosyltransferase [Patescibacteria group bacterium]
MNDDISISLIIPCYNEEINIQKGVLDKIGNHTGSNSRFKEVIIVDDGSTDETKNLIQKEYLPRYPKFRLIENDHKGKAQTLITGIKESLSTAVMFTDIDLATPLEEDTKLLKALDEGYQVVIGSRNTERKGAPFLRKLMAVGFIYIRNFMIGLSNIKDTQCGFKAFRRDAANHILSKLRVFNKEHGNIQGSSVKAGFDLEFLFLANKLGYKIKEVPVTWKHVETKNVNFIKDSVETIRDILAIKYYDLAKKYN